MYANNFRNRIIEKSMSDVAFKILELVEAANRYKNLKIYNFENFTSHDTQFGAITIRTGRETIICYRGTDYALISWIENFRIIYEYPTCTHKYAIDYFKDNIKMFGDRRIYVTGHSKGGNLAMVAAMEAPDRIFKKIKRIDNFDGPGFRKEEFNTSKFKKMAEKLITIVPEKSSVGMLLHNVGYHTVKSNAKSILQHYPNSWGVFGEFLLKGTLSKSSLALNERSIEKIELLDYDEAKESFEALFESTGKDYTSNIELTFEYMSNLLKDAKNLDPKYQKTLYILFEVMSGISLEPKNAKLQKINDKISSIKSTAKSGAQKIIDKRDDIKRDKKLRDKNNDIDTIDSESEINTSFVNEVDSEKNSNTDKNNMDKKLYSKENSEFDNSDITFVKNNPDINSDSDSDSEENIINNPDTDNSIKSNSKNEKKDNFISDEVYSGSEINTPVDEDSNDIDRRSDNDTEDKSSDGEDTDILDDEKFNFDNVEKIKRKKTKHSSFKNSILSKRFKK